jgi:NAD(P)-dependent dehydrogenase (short-subunit alcohol dehydrogenase family)
MSEVNPPQVQNKQPGIESEMSPRPKYSPRFRGAGRLDGKVALISGGDSGIGRAVAVAMAREGASIAIVYRSEHDDAKDTVRLIEEESSNGISISGDIGDENFCQDAVRRCVEHFGIIDILVNNAAEQHECDDLTDITPEQLEQTFRTNVFGCFYLTQAALPFMREGCSIINTASVTAYRGSAKLIDYSATKGAIVSFTRALSSSLVERGIRVNAVAPGPIWTPLIPASFDADRVAKHGSASPMKRAGQPNEVAPAFVFLASEDASYLTGQVIHPNGGEIVNG